MQDMTSETLEQFGQDMDVIETGIVPGTRATHTASGRTGEIQDIMEHSNGNHRFYFEQDYNADGSASGWLGREDFTTGETLEQFGQDMDELETTNHHGQHLQGCISCYANVDMNVLEDAQLAACDTCTDLTVFTHHPPATVTCPACNAAKDTKCVGRNGQHFGISHADRYSKARAYAHHPANQK